MKVQWTMELLCRLLILKWNPRNKKIADPHLEKMNMHCYYFKTQYDAMFKNKWKRHDFVLRLLKSMLNFELEILSLQQPEYEGT